MPDLKAMQEERGELAATLKKLADTANDEKRDFTPEEKGNWDKANEDYDALKGRCEHAQRAHDVEVECNSPVDANPESKPGREDVDPHKDQREKELDVPGFRKNEIRDRAIETWMRSGGDHVTTPEEANLMRSAGIDRNAKTLEIPLFNSRDVHSLQARGVSQRMSTTTTAGGFTIPEGFVPNLERALLAFGGPRQVARIIRTSSGADLPWPKYDDTGNTGELLAEGATVASQDIAFTSMILQAFKYSSKKVLVTQELLEDSAFDLASEVGRALGERIGRITATHFTTGDASSKPNGIMSCTVGATASDTNAIDADELFDLQHSVDPSYRLGASWMMRDTTFKALRKLADSDGQYLWNPGLTAGMPDTLLGNPVVINQAVDAIATSKKVIAYGDFQGYIIRDVASLRLHRLVELHRDQDQDAFISFSRHDGDILTAGALRHLIMSA